AAALQSHDAAAALTHAARALTLAPGHVQALWNRALALRDIGLVRSAAVTFDQVARHGERGWSDEALKRAIALRAAWQNRERMRQTAELAGRALVDHGTAPAPELARAWPELMQHYRALAAHDAKSDPFVALADAEREATAALAQSDAPKAQKLAQAALER